MEHIWKFATLLFCCYMINHIGCDGCVDQTSDTLSVVVLPPCDTSSNNNAIQQKRKQRIRPTTNIQYTPLQDAVVKGLESRVAELLRQGHSANERNAQGDTALHVAIRARQNSIAYILMRDGGANVNMRGYNLTTPLILAAELGNTDVVTDLLSHGANAYAFDINKDKALIVAVRGMFPSLVEVLRLAEYHQYDKHKETMQSAIIEAFDAKRTDIIEMLFKTMSIDKNTTAACMTRIWNEESFWLLVENSAENVINTLHNTLISEVNKNRCHILKYINAGITIPQATLDETLYNSAALGFVDCMEELLTIGANVNAKIDGNTPLYAGAKNGQHEGIKLLLNAGADPNLYKSLGDTTLIAAIKNYCVLCVEILLSNGADVNLAPEGMLPISRYLGYTYGMKDLIKEYESK